MLEEERLTLEQQYTETHIQYIASDAEAKQAAEKLRSAEKRIATLMQESEELRKSNASLRERLANRETALEEFNGKQQELDQQYTALYEAHQRCLKDLQNNKANAESLNEKYTALQVRPLGTVSLLFPVTLCLFLSSLMVSPSLPLAGCCSPSMRKQCNRGKRYMLK